MNSHTFADQIVTISRDYFLDKGEVPGMVFILTSELGHPLILLQELDAVPREYLADAIQTSLAGRTCQALMIVSEAWTVMAKDTSVAPSKHPDRQEALMFSFETPNEPTVVQMANIYRNPLTLGDLYKLEGNVTGRLIDLLVPQPVTEA